MSRRPSTVSFPSSSSAGTSIKASQSSPAIVFKAPKPQSNGHPVLPTRTASLSSQIEAFVKHDAGLGQLNPDELFARHSVSEMRAVQHRLRADAEAKQEELRLMVGERYRDLLQASSSIISIAQTSKRVLDVFEEMKETVCLAEVPRVLKRLAAGEDDKYLKGLQSLSAHLKLLLDAPEQLWRLLERRMYLHATWLFLLTRVIHRGLMQDSEESGKDWEMFGIDVSDQFPIVQRQWDTIVQFRSQITHKATLSLREASSSPGEVCGVLLTLHLLESRPLSETLSTFLSQRTRTLSTLLSSASRRVGNGHIEDIPQSSGRPRKAVLREVKQKIEAVLSLIVHTLETARCIFSENGDKGMMRRTLEAFQSEEAAVSALPTELRLTTTTLLSGLPSSTHLMLLPHDIKSYKPYVDTSSPSSSISPAQLRSKLDDWIRQAVDDIRTSVQAWFRSLESIREVWEVRTQGHEYLDKAAALEAGEKASLSTSIDEVSQMQAIAVWKYSLAHAEATFREHLSAAILILDEHKPEGDLDSRPADHLFRTLPLAAASQSGSNSVSTASSFQRYKGILKQQFNGRTPLLEDVLTSLQRDTRNIHDDLQVMQIAYQSPSMPNLLTVTYLPDAQATCTQIVTDMRKAVDELLHRPEPSLQTLMFIARVADYYSISADFVSDVGCSSETTESIRNDMSALCDTILNTWSERTIRRINKDFTIAPPRSSHQSRHCHDTPLPSRPSVGLLRGLRQLSASLQQLEFSHPLRKQHLILRSLERYLKTVIEGLNVDESGSLHVKRQCLLDLQFLHTVASKWEELAKACDAEGLQSRADNLHQQLAAQGLSNAQIDVETALADYLPRVQTLLYPLLPCISSGSKDKDKLASLLHHGTPVVEQNVQPFLDLVKPSARFGLLLVGSDVAQ